MSVKVIDKGWSRIKKQLKLANGAHVKVGFPKEKDKPHMDSEFSIGELAILHEHGNEDMGIPARPFMNESFDKHRAEIDSFKEKQIDQVLKGSQTIEQGLEKLGLFFQKKIQKTVKAGGFQANDPKTIARKGSSKPLIHSKTMVNSVDYEVVMK